MLFIIQLDSIDSDFRHKVSLAKECLKFKQLLDIHLTIYALVLSSLDLGFY